MHDLGHIPLLLLEGQQGSGKSTFGRVIKSLVDPSNADLVSMPRSEKDLLVTLSKSTVSVFDNISGLTSKEADSFCKSVTGISDSGRALYSNYDQASISLETKGIILNGITELTKRSDFLERCIHIQLPSIKTKNRRTDNEFWTKFKKDSPLILGAFFDLMVKVLHDKSNYNKMKLPRMADFAILGCKVEKVLGYESEEFLKSYHKMQKEVLNDGIDDNLLYISIENYFKHIRLNEIGASIKFEGTVTELYTELKRSIPSPFDDLSKNRMNFPQSIQSLRKWLKRIEPILEEKGYVIEYLPRTSLKRLIRITPPDYILLEAQEAFSIDEDEGFNL